MTSVQTFTGKNLFFLLSLRVVKVLSVLRAKAKSYRDIASLGIFCVVMFAFHQAIFGDAIINRRVSFNNLHKHIK